MGDTDGDRPTLAVVRFICQFVDTHNRTLDIRDLGLPSRRRDPRCGGFAGMSRHKEWRASIVLGHARVQVALVNSTTHTKGIALL